MARVFEEGKYSGQSFEEVYKIYPGYLSNYGGKKEEFRAFKEYASRRRQEPPRAGRFPQPTATYVKGHEGYFLEKMGPYRIESKPVGEPVETYFTQKLPEGTTLETFFLSAFLRYGIRLMKESPYDDPYLALIRERIEDFPIYERSLEAALPTLERSTPLDTILILSLAQALLRGIIEDYQVPELKTEYEIEELDKIANWAEERFSSSNEIIISPLLLDPSGKILGIPLLVLPESGELFGLTRKRTPLTDLDFVPLALEGALYEILYPERAPIRKLTILDARHLKEVSLLLEEGLEGLHKEFTS